MVVLRCVFGIWGEIMRGVGERRLQFTLSSIRDVGNGSGGNIGVGVNVFGWWDTAAAWQPDDVAAGGVSSDWLMLCVKWPGVSDDDSSC
jgi:hypothetical protein